MQQTNERPAAPLLPSPSPSLWAIIRQRWWLIALLVGTAVVVALLAGLLARPTYRSSERLQVIILDQQEVTLFTRLPSTGVNDQMSIILTDFSDIVRSPLIAWRTIDDLDLAMSAEGLLKNLDVTIAGEFMTLSYQGQTAEQAQQVLSRHVANAINHYEALRARPAQATGQFLAKELTQQSQVVATAQADLQALQLQHNVADLTREINAYQDALRGLQAARAALQVEADRADALAAYWREAAEDALDRAAAARAQLAAAETVTATVVADAAQRAAWQAEITAQEAAAEAYRKSALDAAATAAGQRAALSAQDALISQRAGELAQLIGLSQEYDARTAALANARADYEFLRAKLVEARLKERQINEVGYLQVVEPAFLPSSPSPARTLRLVLLAALVSLLLGVVLVLWLEAVQPAARRS